MVFNVGDEITIKKNIRNIYVSNGPGINDDMVSMEGRTCVIREARMHSNRYKLVDCRWVWAGEWFEHAKQYDDIEESELMNMF